MQNKCATRTTGAKRIFLNLVPRVLSLPRESTLVTAGHVSMYTNQISIGDSVNTVYGGESCAAVYVLKVKQVMFQRSCLTGASALSV